MTDLFDRVMLRRWSLDLANGRKLCSEDAVNVEQISPEDRLAIEAKNADIHGAICEVEAYEADCDLIVDDEIMALARLRSGEATDEDRELVALEWGYAVEVEPAACELSAAAVGISRPRRGPGA
jgi:hypothetical protein